MTRVRSIIVADPIVAGEKHSRGVPLYAASRRRYIATGEIYERQSKAGWRKTIYTLEKSLDAATKEAAITSSEMHIHGGRGETDAEIISTKRIRAAPPKCAYLTCAAVFNQSRREISIRRGTARTGGHALEIYRSRTVRRCLKM